MLSNIQSSASRNYARAEKIDEEDIVRAEQLLLLANVPADIPIMRQRQVRVFVQIAKDGLVRLVEPFGFMFRRQHLRRLIARHAGDDETAPLVMIDAYAAFNAGFVHFEDAPIFDPIPNHRPKAGIGSGQTERDEFFVWQRSD
jgi:hypothetical protein